MDSVAEAPTMTIHHSRDVITPGMSSLPGCHYSQDVITPGCHHSGMSSLRDVITLGQSLVWDSHYSWMSLLQDVITPGCLGITKENPIKYRFKKAAKINFQYRLKRASGPPKVVSQYRLTRVFGPQKVAPKYPRNL